MDQNFQHMKLNFERFTNTGGSFAPIISIRKHGAFGVSQGALNKFGLLDGDWYVVLFYDKAAQAVGIQPTRNAEEEGAIKLVKRKAIAPKSGKESISSSISAKAFFEYYGIDCTETRTYRATWDEEAKIIVVKLSEGAAATEEEGESE